MTSTIEIKHDAGRLFALTDHVATEFAKLLVLSAALDEVRTELATRTGEDSIGQDMDSIRGVMASVVVRDTGDILDCEQLVPMAFVELAASLPSIGSEQEVARGPNGSLSRFERYRFIDRGETALFLDKDGRSNIPEGASRRLVIRNYATHGVMAKCGLFDNVEQSAKKIAFSLTIPDYAQSVDPDAPSYAPQRDIRVFSIASTPILGGCNLKYFDETVVGLTQIPRIANPVRAGLREYIGEMAPGLLAS